VSGEIVAITAPIAPVVREQTSFSVREFVDAVQLRKDIAYSKNNLDDAMMNQASMFAFYGVLSAEAARQTDVVKLLLQNAEAAVYGLISGEKATAGEKATVPMMESLVARHPRVVDLKRALNEAKRVEAISKTAVEAFRHRRDMLIQHGLISREEMKGNLKIAERSVRDDALEAQKSGLLDRLKNRANPEE
jgi:hypothetical protein